MREEIARGWDLFRLGAFAEAESLIAKQTHDFEAVRLLLWIAIRRGTIEEARNFGALLASSRDKNLASIGRAHENVALATSNQEIKPWLPSFSRWARSEVAYTRAVIAYMRDETTGVREALSSALPCTTEQRVLYAYLRACSKVRCNDFAGQAHLLSHALTLAMNGRVDRWLTSMIAASLSRLAKDIELGEVSAHADTLLERTEWPVDTCEHQFYAAWGIACRKTLSGELLGAMHVLDDAHRSAPDPLRQGLIHVERARISRAIGERVASQSWVAFAFDALSRVDWSKTSTDDVIDLMGSMDTLGTQSELARTLLERALAVHMSTDCDVRHGTRFDGFWNFAYAHLSTGEGALSHAHRAYRVFKEIKYVHRAAACSIRAFELKEDARWRARAQRLISAYPRSLTARHFERITSPFARIRGRRKEVLDLLVMTSQTAREIGLALGMAENTVRVHIKHLRKLTGVENRLQLVRLYLESGRSEFFARDNNRGNVSGL